MADGTNPTPPIAGNAPYLAASNGRRLRMWRSFTTGPNSAQSGMSTVVARSREAARNDAWAGTAINRSVANGVACGIQCRQKWGTKAFRDEVNELWAQSTPELEASGVLGFEGLQALAWREWREAGECFIRVRPRRPGDDLTVPVQFQLLESEQCPRDLNKTLDSGNRIVCGIEFDKIDRRVAYWFHPKHPGDQNLTTFDSNEPVRVTAGSVFHLFNPLRGGAYRGVPDLASVLVELFNYGSLRDAVLERQRIANLFCGWYTKTDGLDDGDSQLGETVVGQDDDGAPIAGMEPGSMQELPPGVDVEFNEPPGAGSDYAEFVRGGLQAVAARLGIPYEILTGDIRNVSDRALKLNLQEFRRAIEMDQWLFFIPMLLQPMRRVWFDQAILAGLLSLDIDAYFRDRKKIVDALWVPQGWPYSHPVQDVDADIKAIDAGLTSRTAVVMGNGEDVEEVDEQQRIDADRAKALGLTYKSGASSSAAPANNTNPPPDNGGDATDTNDTQDHTQ